MADLSKPSSSSSSSMSFLSSSSSHLSNGSLGQNTSTIHACSEMGHTLEMIRLKKLSTSLEQLLLDPPVYDYTDADIIVEGIQVSVHRCILASRSSFFHDLFKRETGYLEKDGIRPKYCMSDLLLLPHGKVGYEAFQIFLSYVYTGQLKPSPMEVSSCVDNVCSHDSCRPAINFAVELMYASSIFKVPELVSLFQRRLLSLIRKAIVEDVVPILVAAFHCQSSLLVTQCVERIARSDLDNISIEKELPHEVAEDIKLLRRKLFTDGEHGFQDMDPLREKSIKRIHMALDSDDVELVKLLLTESNITLDDAKALHYAAAYCDLKVVSKVLSLSLADDINHRNSRGYTVLHVAAMRRDPSVIVMLLARGACALDLTLDGRSAVSLCRRLTRPKDYHAVTEQGQKANKHRLCIDLLEREMRRNPMDGDATINSHTMSDDLNMKLLYLENRVAFARLLFPTEAKLAMDIAHAETTTEFAGLSASKRSNVNLIEVDLNETPTMQNKRLRSRMEALMKTVEMGRRYFPSVSQVLDKFMEDDLPDLLDREKASPHEQRTRFMELKDDVQKSFNKDIRLRNVKYNSKPF